ncbi:CRISPR-associated protein [Candidatus Chloroploca sp. Khr17]|uniref:CRISPR-associated protein n=1 Tax=Candidatus Chloroploca sp. Khr17 TaxID=2496869 RepID=UPI00101D5589|nr:CRISPR-associated protein [Candidatus Chloroploca sp. Khr17]
MSTTIYHHVVITAGISLFAATNVYGKLARDQELFRFDRSNPLPLEHETEEEARLRWADFCRNADPALAKAKPEHISAEFSLLNVLEKQKRLGKNPQVTLIVTNTLGGRGSAEFIARLLRITFGAEVRTKIIDDLDVNQPTMLLRSLGQFMQIVAQELDGKDPSFTCFAPVGGYKVMTSLGYLAGAYMGFPTAYLHEDNQILHEVPAVPIQIEYNELAKFAPLLRKAQRTSLEWDQMSFAEQTYVNQHPYLFYRLETLVALSAFGIFIAGRPEYAMLFNTQVYASKAVEKEFQGSDREFLCGQVRELLKKLDNAEAYWGELCHELTFEKLKGQDLVSHLYKGASKGTLVFRAAYRYDQDSDALFLNRIWTNHGVYEREASRSSGLRAADQPEAWCDLSRDIWDR